MLTSKSYVFNNLFDNSKIDKPVPLDKQLPGFLHCDKCLWKTKDKGYYRKHMTWLCKALKSQQLSKCKYCDKMFRHESTLRQHLQVHNGIKRVQMPKMWRNVQASKTTSTSQKRMRKVV